MIAGIDLKFVLAILSAIVTVWAFRGYFVDIFKKKTTPHLYTWLIWSITQGTATAALIYGGGGFGAISLTVGTILVVAIFFLSFKYGKKNITRSDTVVLIAALLAIVVWWQLKNPLLAVLMVSVIDGLGYIPTFRKSFEDPWSETMGYWATVALLSLSTIVASNEYNLLTVTYLAVLFVLNTIVWFICFWRRRTISRLQKGS